MFRQQEELIFKQQQEAKLKHKQEEAMLKRHEAAIHALSKPSDHLYAQLARIPQPNPGEINGQLPEYVLEKSISHLNSLLAQILTALYDDTRHTNAIATGMLSSLFDSESIGTMEHESCSPGPVLDQSLGIHQSLAYGKRSGGERKRLDLALFSHCYIWVGQRARIGHITCSSMRCLTV
ncbi:hypothetical protein SNK05_013610 [Fusarium graminearum]